MNMSYQLARQRGSCAQRVLRSVSVQTRQWIGRFRTGYGIAAAFVIVAGAISTACYAQAGGYPAKPVRVIVPYAAGSPMEVPVRLVAQVFSETTGQSFVIENRAGAAGTIGTDFVAKAPGDGYTALFHAAVHTRQTFTTTRSCLTTPCLTLRRLRKSTKHTGTVARPPVGPGVLAEGVYRARKGTTRKTQLRVGRRWQYPRIPMPRCSPSKPGSSLRMCLTRAPQSPLTSELVGGQVEVMFGSVTTSRPYIRTGRLRALGLGGPRREPMLPEVPTFHEAGLTGYAENCWHGMWFPAGVPATITRRMHAEVVKALAVPEVRRRLEENSFIPIGNSPEEFAEFLIKERAHQASIAQKIGTKPQ